MFLRPEQQAPAPATPTAQQTSHHEASAQTSRPQQNVQQSEPHNSSGKAEAQAVQEHVEAAPSIQGSEKVLALLMESMEIIAEQLKDEVRTRMCVEARVKALTSAINRITETCQGVRKLGG